VGRALWIAFAAIFTSLLLYLAFVGHREQVERMASSLPNVLSGLTALVERISLPGKSQIAKGPEASQPQKSIATPPVSITNVEYRVDGQLVLAGTAAPGDQLDFFIDGTKTAPQMLKADGTWKLVVPEEVLPGAHRLEVSIPASEMRPRTVVVMNFVKAGADEIAAVAASRKIAEVTAPKKDLAEDPPEQRLRKPSTGFSKLAELAQSQSVRRDVNPLSGLSPKLLIDDGPLLATPQSGVTEGNAASRKTASEPETGVPMPWLRNSQPQQVSPRPQNVEQAQNVNTDTQAPKKAAVPNTTVIEDKEKTSKTGSPEVTVSPGKGLVVVQPGNTLWDLAISIYGSSRYYQKLYRANRHIIKDPRRIFPGQVIFAPDANPPTRIEPNSPPQWSPPQ